MLYTVGDTHGNQYKWVEQIETVLSPSDIILVCGDFGVGFWNGRYWSEESFYDLTILRFNCSMHFSASGVMLKRRIPSFSPLRNASIRCEGQRFKGLEKSK